MILIINDIMLPLDFVAGEAFSEAKKRLRMAGIKPNETAQFAIFRRSVDARKKDNVRFNVSVSVQADLPLSDLSRLAANKISVRETTKIEIPTRGSKKTGRPLIVGCGPAGLFAALILAENGYRPILVEQGGTVEERVEEYKKFFSTRTLNPLSNIQFGAGGAGTFSDGKLVTRINDPYTVEVLHRFVSFGAPEDILWQAKPHVGTDLLRGIVSRMCKHLQELGTEFHFHTRVININKHGKEVVSVQTDKGDIMCGALILAIGNSSSDLFYKMIEEGLPIEPKPFSVGMRVEHKQKNIDEAMYGRFAGHTALGHAEYTLSCDTSARGVYTFCMCPGGEVVCGSSEENTIVVNGMSNHARNGENANSAIAVSVFPSDYANNPVEAISFRQKIERAAYQAGGGKYRAPAVTVGDFLQGKAIHEPTDVVPSYLGGDVTVSDPSSYLPPFITDGLKRGLSHFERIISGFSSPTAVLTGPETRTSSPIRLLRDNDRVCFGTENLFPCGEGAGYAGGITSSATDGLRTALAVISKFAPID